MSSLLDLVGYPLLLILVSIPRLWLDKYIAMTRYEYEINVFLFVLLGGMVGETTLRNAKAIYALFERLYFDEQHFDVILFYHSIPLVGFLVPLVLYLFTPEYAIYSIEQMAFAIGCIMFILSFITSYHYDCLLADEHKQEVMRRTPPARKRKMPAEQGKDPLQNTKPRRGRKSKVTEGEKEE